MQELLRRWLVVVAPVKDWQVSGRVVREGGRGQVEVASNGELQWLLACESREVGLPGQMKGAQWPCRCCKAWKMAGGRGAREGPAGE